jgi:hypothetical protein
MTSFLRELFSGSDIPELYHLAVSTEVTPMLLTVAMRMIRGEEYQLKGSVAEHLQLRLKLAALKRLSEAIGVR